MIHCVYGDCARSTCFDSRSHDPSACSETESVEDSDCVSGSDCGIGCVDSGMPAMVCDGAQMVKAIGVSKWAMENADDERSANAEFGDYGSVQSQSDFRNCVARGCANGSRYVGDATVIG